MNREQSNTIVSGKRTRTLAELDRRARCAAAALQDLGLTSGDRIGLLMRNDFAYFEAMRAAARIGAIAVPLNWHLTVGEIGGIMEHSRAKALIAHDDLLDSRLAEACGAIRIVTVPTPDEIRHAYSLSERTSSERAPCWSSWLEHYAPVPDQGAVQNRVMFYTSGTSGHPKGVSRAAAPAKAIAQAAQRSAAAWGFNAQTVRAIVPGPLYHSAPNAYSNLLLQHGGLLVMQPRFDAERLLELIAEHRISHLYMTPTMFVRLLALPATTRKRYDISSIRHVSHGAAPCPAEVKRKMLEWWGDVLVEYYALTETGILTSCESAQWRRHPGSVGRAAEGIELKVLREDGSQATAGETGEICVKSSLTSHVSYYRDEAETRKMHRDGYLATGDLGYLNPEGYLHVTGRISDMVISGGVNLYPAEIEAVLASCPGIEDSAVFGVPDPEFGERLVAVLQAAQSAKAVDAAQVRDFLSGRLARFKIPGEFHFLSRLPREDSGKIRKRFVRAEYLKRPA